MKDYAAAYILEILEKRNISVEEISKTLEVPVLALIPGNTEKLESDDFLRICKYLKIRPENVMKDMDIK